MWTGRFVAGGWDQVAARCGFAPPTARVCFVPAFAASARRPCHRLVAVSAPPARLYGASSGTPTTPAATATAAPPPLHPAKGDSSPRRCLSLP